MTVTGLGYVLSPYSHPDPRVVQERLHLTRVAVAELVMRNYRVFSTVIHCHELCLVSNLGGDACTWIHYNRLFMERSDYGIVLRIDGWGTSKGIRSEVDFFRQQGKPLLQVEFTTTRRYGDYDRITIFTEV